MKPLPTSTRRLLDFDIETVAAGYGDPEFVTSTVTAYAYSWGDDIEVSALPVRYLYDVPQRRKFLKPLLEALSEADVLTGHNILRFDLPVLQAEAMRLGFQSLGPVLVQDTMRMGRTKGFRKGQDNLGVLLKVKTPKLPLNFQEWAEAYGEPDLATVKDRVASDVRQHQQVRAAMLERGWLAAPLIWKPA